MTSTWESVQLGDVLQLEYGKPLPDENRAESGRYAVYGANGEKARSNRYYHDKPSIVVGRKGSAGEINLTEGKFWPLDVTYFTTFDESRYELKFLYYLLGTLDLPSMARGVKPGINRNDVYSLNVLVPPLSEQYRIVAILDEAFAGIATAKANAEKGLRNAGELLESGSQSVLDSVEVGAETTLEAVAAEDCSLSYGIVQPGDDVENGLPVVRPVDLTRQLIGPDGLKRIDPALAAGYQRTKLQGGELLLCVRGTTGTVSLASPELKGANVTRGIVPIRFNPKLVSKAFGYHLMKSASVQAQIREKTYGTALMQINIGDLRNLLLRIPPLAKQQELAARLDALRNEVLQLQSTCTRKLAALDELKQSLLQQAFSGQL